MCKKAFVSLIPVCLLFALFLTGCRSGKKDPSPAPSGKFMEHDSGRSVAGNGTGESKNYFARERERRRQYEREFKDVRRPMDQDHFKVMPWHGKHYTPRSERLHESSLEADSSLYRF